MMMEKGKNKRETLLALHSELMRRPRLGRRMGFVLIGIVIVALLGTLFYLSRIYGGGDVVYDAKGSPGPVVFHHRTHRSGKTLEGKKFRYECKECHEKLYAAEKYGTFIINFLKSSDRTARTGRDSIAIFVPPPGEPEDIEWPTIEVERACVSCSTGKCHNGTDSFSRFECLKCHRRR
ncbi:MAG: hypothetical protein JRI46_04995 [Deltaproteobacteria bacterium]|nr:hypothetical protein [Deltaproteobacteria bacterium]